MTIHRLPELGYSYDTLEPYIDTKTMEIHHTKHHQAYIDNLNKAIQGAKDLEGMEIQDILSNLKKVPESIRTAVINHGGGHYNHSFFWPLLKKEVKPAGPAVDAITKKFGGFDKFKELFKNAALGRFGSGWAWVVLDQGGLEIISTPNQDSPISGGKIPILGIDVWEHAYYLKYQNRRGDYIVAFFNVINWEKVNENYLTVVK